MSHYHPRGPPPPPPPFGYNHHGSTHAHLESKEFLEAKEIFGSIERIATALGTLKLKEVSEDVVTVSNLEGEDCILSRICRCEIDGTVDYKSELEHRLNDSTDPDLLYHNALASTGLFDIGFVEQGGRKLLWIISPVLRAVVEKLLMPHPAIYSSGWIMCILPPYEPFIHKYADIKKYLETHFSEEAGKSAWQSLDYFMKQNASKRVWQTPQDFERGASVSFEELWNLFRPDDKLVLTDDIGNKEVLMFTSMNSTTVPMQPQHPGMISQPAGNFPNPEKSNIDIVAWGLVKDRYSGKLKPQSYRIPIGAFEGTTPITSLAVYPLRYFETESEEAQLLLDLTARGHRWKTLNSVEQSMCYYYDGPAFSTYSHYRTHRLAEDRGNQRSTENLSSRVVISREDLDDRDHHDRGHIIWMHPTYGNPGSQRHMALSEETDFEAFAFLCPSVVRVTDVKTQRSFFVGITESLSQVEWNKGLFEKQLIIPSVKRTLLSGLVGNRIKGTYKRMGDMIDQKGQGLIVLLHGPPGTGKTFVAEAIADYFERPLRALSIGELIADYKNLEENLTEVFDECRRWNAILLLDEADVVLEARSLKDITRNAIVSTFLRNLEYFEGIMFLTTNRIGTIDEAFMSRIQIAIHMDTLQTPERRQLWERFLGAPTSDKIMDEIANDKLFLTPDARQELLENINEWAAMKLNGREIRNTINIAQSLAYTRHGEDGLMSPSDVRDAAREAMDFRSHLSTARQDSDTAESAWGVVDVSDNESADD